MQTSEKPIGEEDIYWLVGYPPTDKIDLGNRMSTLVWLLGFALTQVPLYFLYRKTINNTRQLTENRFATILSPDVRQEEMGETFAVLTLGNVRKKLITGLMMCFVVGGFLISWGAGWGPQPDRAEWESNWPTFVVAIALGYFVGGVAPWLGAVFYDGEFRVITKNGILRVSTLFRTYFVRWDQIRFVDIRDWGNTWWFVVRTDKGTFSVWSECVDLGVFIEGIVNNLSMEKWKPIVDKGKIAVRKEQVQSQKSP